MSNAEIGAVGEQLVALKFAQRGVPVFFPFGALGSADLAVDMGGRVYKIQVKTVSSGTRIEFRLRRNRNQAYNPGEVDLYALVSLDPPNVAMVPYRKGTVLTVDFEKLRPEWAFNAMFEQMREGGIA